MKIAVTPVAIGWGAFHRVAIDGRRVVAGGSGGIAVSTDAEHFHFRDYEGAGTWGLSFVGGALYALSHTCVEVSRDLGMTWTKIKLPGYGYRFHVMRDRSATWWMGCAGSVATSRDGVRWKKSKLPARGRVIHLAEHAGRLFVIGARSSVWDGKKLTRLPFDKAHVLNRMIVLPSKTIIVVGSESDAERCRGVIYRSTDDGATFQRTIVQRDVQDVAMLRDELVAVGGGGWIWRSRDDGRTFTKLESGTNDQLWGIASWGTGALVASERKKLLRLTTPGDRYWRGATDAFAKPPAPRRPRARNAFKPVLAELDAALVWLGRQGRLSADESGDWRDYRAERWSLHELAYDYWSGLGHEAAFARAVARLPEATRRAAEVASAIEHASDRYTAAFCARDDAYLRRDKPPNVAGKPV
jgi:hypothetical protein